MKERTSALEAIVKLGRLIFTSRELAGFAGTSVSSITQSLNKLCEKGLVQKITHGLWGQVSDRRFSPNLVIPYLDPSHQAYLSFVSALHARGVISQIPQVTTVASTARTRTIETSVGVFDVHQISGDFFDGFDWYEGGDYLIATPEKAFVDCLYLASRKGKRFAHFPELDMSLLNKKKIREWVGKIKDARIRKAVEGLYKNVIPAKAGIS